jgi:hypothetical protein
MPSSIPEQPQRPADARGPDLDAGFAVSSPDRPLGEAQSVPLASGLPRLMLTVAVNALVLAEVFVAMYFAAQTPDEITPIFFKLFFSMLLPTLLAAFILKRVIARRGRR